MREPWARPDVGNIKAAYDRLFRASLSLSKIRDAALEGRLLGTGAYVAGRSIAWKLFLLSPEQPLQPASTSAVHAEPWVQLCSSLRQKYRSLLLEKMRAPDGSYEEGLVVPGQATSPLRSTARATNLDTNNPLSLHTENPWKEWFAAMELRKTIRQDVERTFPDIAYFRDPDVQAQLTHVLYVWSARNPEIGYRQGMHELLAMLYCALDFDSVDEHGPAVDGVLGQLCSRTWVAADAWGLFDSVMHAAGKWYEWRESSTPAPSAHFKSHVNLNLERGQANPAPYVSPIIQACNEIQNKYLKTTDPQLWRSMQAAGIEPQIYGIRWLRLLFTRELTMPESMIIWDGLFACDQQLTLAPWICVAMLIRIRNQLIPSDYSEQLTYLLRYPPFPAIDMEEPGAMHPSILLLRQAVGLHLSPSPATGVAVMVENRNMLHIPMEVPEPRPPPPRRGARAPPPSSVPPLERNTVRPFHIKQLSAQAQNMNLPDLARGLLDRGESLGINRTSFFSAVSELRRNLPDIAASAASLIKTPSMNTPPAFPLLDESTPEERPPWEPKSRREMEQELDELKASQRRLGQSVGWIVDALLQSEGGDHDDEAVQKIRKRKQDALESLSYVRDVLQGHVPSIDEERLWDDVELQRRKYQATQADSEATAALPSSPPATAGVAVPTPSARPFMPRFSPPIPTPLSPSPTPSTSSILPVELKPNANATPLAPWKYTRSNFSAPVSSVTPPPPTSAALPKSPPLAPSKPSVLAPVSTSNVRHETVAMTPTRSSGPGEPAARKQAVEYDPLGALH